MPSRQEGTFDRGLCLWESEQYPGKVGDMLQTQNRFSAIAPTELVLLKLISFPPRLRHPGLSIFTEEGI
jgi:hypothetical protein